VLPLYFLLLVPTGPWEVVAWRVLLSFVFCLLLLTVTRGWAPFGVILRQPKLLGWTALAGLLIYINWQVFLIGTLSGNVVETSLGYFINPITTVLLGVFVLKESIRKLQWAAIAIAAIAVVVIVVAYGDFPWIALSLTASFGVYGLIKKKIGPAVDAVSGLTLESFWLIPIAVVQLIVVASTPAGITMGGHGWVHAVLLAFAGVATAVPLLLFAAGTRRINLTVIGMIQFITPVMQFVIGVAVLHEPMPPERWAGFVIVWIAIGVFVVDLLIAGRRGRRIARTDLV
jgi:chloramphenicol-sensitive protein RarD